MLAAVGGIGFALAGSLAALLASRALVGAAAGCFIPAARAIVASVDPDRSGANLGRLARVDLAGFATGPIIGGVLFGLVGLRGTFLFFAIVAAVAFALLAPRPLPALPTSAESSRPSLVAPSPPPRGRGDAARAGAVPAGGGLRLDVGPLPDGPRRLEPGDRPHLRPLRAAVRRPDARLRVAWPTASATCASRSTAWPSSCRSPRSTACSARCPSSWCYPWSRPSPRPPPCPPPRPRWPKPARPAAPPRARAWPPPRSWPAPPPRRSIAAPIYEEFGPTALFAATAGVMGFLAATALVLNIAADRADVRQGRVSSGARRSSPCPGRRRRTSSRGRWTCPRRPGAR